MAGVGKLLRQGYVVTMDYGFPASNYYAPFRVGGTLTAYREHQRSGEVLADPGRQDITAHVDFTTLARAGEAAPGCRGQPRRGRAVGRVSDRRPRGRGVGRDDRRVGSVGESPPRLGPR